MARSVSELISACIVHNLSNSTLQIARMPGKNEQGKRVAFRESETFIGMRV
jgi:hypothetical protein